MKVRTCIIYKDGTEAVLRLPPGFEEAEDIVTSRPGHPENIKACYSHTTSRDVDVFVEVD